MPASHQCSKEAGTPKYKFGSLHNQSQESQPCLFTLSRANLALTLTKLVLRTKDLIFMLLDGLEVFLGVSGMSSNSSNLQMVGKLIYIYIYI